MTVGRFAPKLLVSGAPTLCQALFVLIVLSGFLCQRSSSAEPGPSWESLPWEERIGAAWFKNQAEAGDAEAQYRLGEIYESGLGEPGSKPDDAIGWYRKAASQGHARAAFRLGHLLEQQGGQEEVVAEAYRQASLAYLPEATYNLARLYRDGTGVRQDQRWAARLYRQAYGAGVARAAMDLAQLALVGPGRDEVVALAWALRAEDEGLAGGAALAQSLSGLLDAEQRRAAERLSRRLPRPEPSS